MSLGPERSDIAPPVPAPFTEEPTRQLLVAGASDHCVNCGSPLASDQRYCVTCGERRGKPRFTLAGPHEEAVQEVVTGSSSSAPRRPRTSAGFNLIAGVATLLLAMGVGVLIGHNNSSSNGVAKAPAAQVITVNSGGTASGSTGSAAAATGSTSGSGSGGTSKAGTSKAGTSKHHASGKSAKAAPPKVVIQKAAAAASKVTGGTAKVADPTATTGSSCTSGTAGCQNGKLTGNYFGP
ncbi:MAG: hypothetical protein ACXVRW_06960 [Solirubrobacteraceae bacterium]